MDKDRFNIYVIEQRIFSNSQKAHSIQDKNKIGELKEGKIIYSSFEAFYLFETKKANILNIKDIKLSETELLKLFSKIDKDFYLKYLVYKNLKNKGYVVKTGLKFGEEFRIYTKQDYIKNHHAKYICFPIKSSEKIDPKDFISKTRITHSTGKKLLLAIVDNEEDISYYEIDWLKI
ncbi:MAG: tRNA-intron lyase [Nanoarchaeota archaeon]|nr:tRNA-intron lyase [Nanoarchaeota archaeon]